MSFLLIVFRTKVGVFFVVGGGGGLGGWDFKETDFGKVDFKFKM